MNQVTPVEYVGRKFALQTKEGKVTRVGQILQEFTFQRRKYFAIKSNAVKGNMNLYWYDVTMKYLHRNNIMFLPKDYPLTYQKVVNYDKKGNVLKRGQKHLKVRSERLKFTY